MRSTQTLKNCSSFFIDENRETESYYQAAMENFIQMVSEASRAKDEQLTKVYADEMKESWNKLYAEKSRILKQLEEIQAAADNEFFYGREWKTVTCDDFMKQLDEYIIWYNEERIKLQFKGSIKHHRIEMGINAV